jgi:hypothetical protein
MTVSSREIVEMFLITQIEKVCMYKKSKNTLEIISIQRK